MKLSILMPVYNEGPTVLEAIKRVLDVSYPCDIELVVVDDGRTDRTTTLLAGIGDPRVSVGWHERNRGQGAAKPDGPSSRFRRLHDYLRCRSGILSGGDPDSAQADPLQ